MASSSFCSHCGRPVAGDDQFCGFCGARLELAEGSPPAPPAPVARPYRPYEHDRRETGSHERRPSFTTGEELAGMGTRTGAYLLTVFLPGLIGWIPVLGWLASLGLTIWNLVLFRRGQDIGARILKVRVVRDTGELAGFYHMWTRGVASILSLVVVLAGYWTAYFDTERQTWHDKIMGTHVVVDGPEVSDRAGTSSQAAIGCFWISVVLLAVPMLFAFVAAVTALG